jgi:hypothetical protein
MSNDKNDTHVTDGQVGIINNGKIEVKRDINVKMGGVTHSADKTAEDRQKLIQIVGEMHKVLETLSIEHEKDGEKLKKRTDDLVEELDKDTVDAELLAAKGNLLKTAAENIKDTLPTVLGIATSIISYVMKIAQM